MLTERIAKLDAEAESLLTLTIRAYERFLFLRPMMVNQQLIDRIAAEANGVGFRQLRNWLYWGFVQELIKICSDNDLRTPCISKVRRKLEDPETLKALEDKYATNNREMWPETELRSEFCRIHTDFQTRSQEMLSSDAADGYKTIRDKLISHNELRKSENGYRFLDLKELNLKYGHERLLLKTVRGLVDDLLSLVRNVDFAWDAFFRQEKNIVCQFWQIDAIEPDDDPAIADG